MTDDSDRNDGDTDDTYLFVVSYDQDAERKRIEYLFNNWTDGEIEKPGGLVRIASGVEHDELYEKIVGKVPSEQVESYRLEPVEADVEREQRTVEQVVEAPVETVESFVEYIFSKKNAVLQSPAHNEYEVYTKKGRAEVSYRTRTDAEATEVTIELRGYPPAPEFLGDFFEAELRAYAESQR